MKMQSSPDPFLVERTLDALSRSPEALSEHRVASAVGEPVAMVVGALDQLVSEGLVAQTPNRSYVATNLGRTRTADAITAAMESEVDDSADAITAAFVALDPDTHATLLAAEMFALAPEVYADQMAPHIAQARRRMADAQRFDRGTFAGGAARARRARVDALDALVAAARVVDPTKTRADVLLAAVRMAGSQGIVASQSPTPALRRTSPSTGAGVGARR